MNHHKFLMIYMLKYYLKFRSLVISKPFNKQLSTVIQDNIRLNIICHQQIVDQQIVNCHEFMIM